jgi:protein-S-isoprenylcysteine O-methyltransferase Ste14
VKDIFEFLLHVYELSPVPLRIAYGFWAAFIGLYIYASYHDRFNSPTRVRTRKRQNYSRAYVLLGFFTVAIYFLAKSNNWPIHQSLFSGEAWGLIGLPFMLVGLVLIGAARAALNGYWGPHIYTYADSADNVLVQRGVYGTLRHPIYLGQVLMAIGTLLLSNSTIFLLFAAPLILINIARSKRESAHLLEVFGQDFVKYKENTSWLFPDLF